MSEKLEVRGDVAQLIGGNVNEAPRQNNVVNFHMTGEKTVELMLTDLQRKRISALVKELCGITKEKPLDVYRVILTDFGAERMKDMPRVKYHEVVEQVEQWIAENTQEAAMVSVMKEDVSRASTQAPEKSCEFCRASGIESMQSRSLARFLAILSAILGMICTLLLYKFAGREDAALHDEKCYFAGQPYSVGSTINTSGTMQECVVIEGKNSNVWAKKK